MQYARDYRERHRLDDGTLIEFRAVQPGDKALLADGFARLSPESRRRRFFTSKTGLSDEELRYLTEFDGTDHYALGAMRAEGPGAPEGLGVARFVRSTSDPETAEISIVVVDDWQHRGIGKRLLQRIVGAAAERGISGTHGDGEVSAEDLFDVLFSTLRLVALGSFVVPIWFGRQTVRRLLALGRGTGDSTGPAADEHRSDS